MEMSVARETVVRLEETLPLYDATELTKGGELAKIKLDDKLYTLRITRTGKLLLTK